MSRTPVSLALAAAVAAVALVRPAVAEPICATVWSPKPLPPSIEGQPTFDEVPDALRVCPFKFRSTN